MKKTSSLILGIAICLHSWAQNSKVTSAAMHLNAYNNQQDTAELSEAKQAIDEASVNDKTKDEPKMYLNRGEVYITYFGVHLNNLISKSIMTSGKKDLVKARNDAYTNIDTNAICIAANSFIKLIQIAPNDYYAEEAKQPQNLPSCLIHLENKALREYSAQRYTTSLALYKKILSICNVLNKTSDSAYKQNVEMAANSAADAKNNPVALVYYQQLMDLKYGGSLPYRSLSDMYLSQNDSVKAWDYIEKGRALYPDDLSLIITETNFYIVKHNFEKAVNNLVITIQKVENSPYKDKNKALLSSLYANLGTIYDRKANPKDVNGKDLPKPTDYDSLFAKADSNYSRALAINPADFTVLFSTGALYFNRAVPITQQANKLPLNATDKYNKLMAQAKAYFLQAQPYFEKAYKIDPNDVGNINALKQVYTSTDQNDKAEALKSKK